MMALELLFSFAVGDASSQLLQDEEQELAQFFTATSKWLASFGWRPLSFTCIFFLTEEGIHFSRR